MALDVEVPSVAVGFVGLGAIGSPIAGCLASAYRTRVWARRSAVAQDHARLHGSMVASIDELRQVDVLVTCLPTSAEVEEVLARIGPLREGAVVVDTTSGDPSRTGRIAERLADQHVEFLDAPVSGGVAGARRGELLAMVGGETAVLERVRPVLASFCTTIVHVGPVGSGHAIKAINNTLMALGFWAASEGLGVLRSIGIEDAVALEVLNGSSGRSHATLTHLPRLLEGRDADFSLRLMAKDVGIAAALARAHLPSAPALQLVDALFSALAETNGEEDLFRAFDIASGAGPDQVGP